MPSNYEECRDKFLDLLRWYEDNKGSRNEAATRMHLIDSVLFDCLGWERKEDCEPEEPHGKEFADYVMKCPMRSLLVEAKREGIYFEIPTGKQNFEYSLSSLAVGNTNFKKAVDQAAGYCQHRGIPLALVTNGHQYAAFIGSRDDGIAPNKGRVVVFCSMQFIADHFFDFWQYFSKAAIEDRNLHRKLLGKRAAEVPSKLSLRLVDYPGNISRNVLQTDLQNLSDWVLEDIPGLPQIQKKFLDECYCANNALSQYSLLSKKFLKGRYDAIFSNMSDAPYQESALTKKGVNPSINSEAAFQRPILLVGDVGSGKTTFINRLIVLEANDVFNKALTIYINFGAKAAIGRSVQDVIHSEIDNQLKNEYEVDINNDSFVRKVYHQKLHEFEQGIYGRLKEVAPEEYIKKEIEYLANLCGDKELHAINALRHLSVERHKQVIVFLDNVDQRDDEIQQKVFLASHEMAESWPAAIFVAIRPETFRRSRDSGALSGYHTKVFTIAPPRTDLVLDKRLGFALQLLAGKHGASIPTNLEPHTIRNLEVFLKVLRNSLHRNEDLIHFIDNVAGGNMRLAIDYIKQFIGSGHVDSEKIITAYINKGGYLVPVHEMVRAVMYGDSTYYEPNSSPIANLFDIEQPKRDGHFAIPMLLDICQREGLASDGHGFVTITHVRELLQGAGLLPDQVDYALSRTWRHRLIETSNRIKPIGAGVAIQIRITSKGAYHLHKLLLSFTYIDAMIIDTPILDQEMSDQIVIGTPTFSQRIANVGYFIDYLDNSWAYVNSDAGFDWGSISKTIREDLSRALESSKKFRK